MESIADCRAVLGEGPTWVQRESALYWVDIPEKAVFRWTGIDGYRKINMSHHVCSILPRETGGFIGGGYDSFIAIDSDFTVEKLAAPEAASHPDNRFNDGKIDRAGRLWAGTMDRSESSTTGSLYRLDADLAWSVIDSGYHVTNGPAFSPDGSILYHTDSAHQRIYAFDLDANGEVSNRRIFAQFGEGDGYPDGMTVDAEGCLWIAFWDGWCIRRLSPRGERLAEIATPVQRPTSCAFGGDTLDELFITSASRDLSPEELERQPLAGGVFRTRPGVTGIAELAFAG